MKQNQPGHLFRSMLAAAMCMACITTLGCECPHQTVSEAYAQAAFVLTGKVIGVDTVSAVDSNLLKHPPDPGLVREILPERLRLSVTRVVVQQQLKGLQLPDTIEVFTWRGRSFCAFEFEADATYIIYAASAKAQFDAMVGNYQLPGVAPQLWVGQCTRTRRYKQAEMSALNKLR